MQVKCDFCGSFMEDSEYSCPNCGATNAHLTRTAPQTPKTIEELKAWYEERHLPPYETTRFFIGIDYKEPKAFGVYKDGLSYIVYKNKEDGTRAIRYSGNDEAYAVNELYLRLKEEILNQKNHSAQNAASTRTTSQGQSRKGCLGLLGRSLIWLAGAIFLMLFVALGVNAVEQLRPQYGGYYAVNDDAYYFFGYASGSEGYEWWSYNPSDESWGIFLVQDNDKDFPEGITRKDYCGTLQSLADKIGYQYESVSLLYSDSLLNIKNSRLYKDIYHSAPSESTYYVNSGRSYYYLSDLHGAAYGKQDNSGWYTYDDGWEYYCDADDREILGDELWYDADKYAVGHSYSDYISGSAYYFNQADTWNSSYYASDFGNTTWYEEYEAATAAYNESTANQSSSSSSSSSDDSSWDWSSSDTWDSGSTDWGSDW